ncbi:MAG: hypothetical protein ABIJ59_08630 [Pseudomonadota bacterium]
MGKIKYLVIALFFVAAGTAAFYFVFDSREFMIKRQFGFIAEKIEKSSGESPVISIEKVNSLTKAIADPCLIHIPVYSYSRMTDSKDLSSYVHAMRSWYSKISLIFHDFLFENMDENSSQVTVTVKMKGALNKGEIFEDIYDVSSRVQKIEGTWKLIEIKVAGVREK